ncbi:MAG: phasin family protein [Caulobacterales bacterium]|uniref:phasin family protein n=1 Tax=Glycocaulis sp. TaxID=1969725 RepID=UPI003F9ED709
MTAETEKPAAASAAKGVKAAMVTAEARSAKAKALAAKTETKARPGAASAKKAAPATPKTASRKPSAPRKFTGNLKGVTPMAAAKKDLAKETFETFTAASNDAVKEGIEKSMTAMNDFSAFHKNSVEAVIASATTASKGFEELNALAAGYAKKSMEDGMLAAKSLASAKSVQEVIEIHSEYTKSSLEAYLAEMNKVSDHVSSMMKDSMKPINERFAAAVELMQSQR